MKKSQPKESTLEGQEALQDLVENQAEEYIATNGKRYIVSPIYVYTEDKIDRIYVNYAKKKKMSLSENSDVVTEGEMNTETRKYFAKVAAAILLNGHYFLLKFFHWIYWRYLYKHSNLNGYDYLQLISLYKKKEMIQWYSLTMALSMQSVGLWTEMTKKEAEEYRAELKSVVEQRS